MFNFNVINWEKYDYKKILNNNVVITTDENDKEIVVMGKGIALKKCIGDYIPKEMIDKVFLDYIEEKFKIRLADDEAGFTALYILNAQME